MNENKRIDQLFDIARVEKPKVAYQETKAILLKATGAGILGALLLKWGFLSTKLKAIIMIGSIGFITVSVGLVVTTMGTGELKNKSNNVQMSQAEVNVQNMEVENNGNVEKTTYLDERDNVIKVVIDSQMERKADNSFVLPIDTIRFKRSVDVLEIPLKGTSVTSFVKDSITANSAGKRVVFRVTEKTTAEELESIFEKAKSAGLKVDYNTKIRRNLIKRIHWKMSITREDGESDWMTNITTSDSFSCMIGWMQDESGKAIGFIKKTKTSCCVSY